MIVKRLKYFFISCFFAGNSYSQGIGIGTNAPHSSAILEMHNTSKGILFPRMTTLQKLAIQNPANGLHVFDTDEKGLSYFDSAYGIWNSYNSEFRISVITITTDVCKLNFFDSIGKYSFSRKFLLIIPDTVIISGCATGDTALDLSKMPPGEITIRNYGIIAGAGGKGGNGTRKNSTSIFCSSYPPLGENGGRGGSAIATNQNFKVKVMNNGLIAAGGGGGATGSYANPFTSSDYGGGGGGGAGYPGGAGGNAGLYHNSSCINGIITSQPGIIGGGVLGGAGGLQSGAGTAGGNGGGLGQSGLSTSAVFTGGAAGKAIIGGTGNQIVNIGSGQYIGIVD